MLKFSHKRLIFFSCLNITKKEDKKKAKTTEENNEIDAHSSALQQEALPQEAL